MINYIIFGILLLIGIRLGMYTYKKAKSHDGTEDGPYLDDATDFRD